MRMPLILIVTSLNVVYRIRIEPNKIDSTFCNKRKNELPILIEKRERERERERERRKRG